jgi:tetraacyldisaccharide 4'-kinase
VTAASTLEAAWLRRGPLAWALRPLSLVYASALGLKRALYRLGWKKPVSLPVPVLVVGNLIAGGAGKTPTTIALVHLLREHGFVPGIVSRGYGRASNEVAHVGPDTPPGECGDEPLLIHLRTRAPVVVAADRVAAARALLAAHPGVTLIVSDDGLQHWRLGRLAQVIVFDERGAGNGWLLPAGPLREPVPATTPSRSTVLYNAARASTPLPGHLASRRLSGATTLHDWWAGHPPQPETLAALRGRRVLAAAGVARPRRFFDMLRAAGLDIAELALDDHHDFATPPWPAGTADVIVTEKDAVKLRLAPGDGTRIWVATLDFELSPAFATDVMQWLAPPTRT